MPYTVQFVGLVCFYRDPSGGRLALLPDGRDPGPGIDPHHGSIVIAPQSIQKTSGWEGVEGAAAGTFPLAGCEVVLEGAEAPGVLDAKDHSLPELRKLNPEFEIDPAHAQTVAKVPIRRGKLTAHLIPGGGAAISQLDVPHDGPITITVKPDGGGPARTIVVKPGTEIAVANMASGGVYAESKQGVSHFKIYEKLSTRGVSLPEPTEITGLKPSESRHLLFSKRRPIGLYVDCTNTGCC